MIVNTKENMPANIRTIEAAQFKFLSVPFLDSIVQPGLNNGIKRKDYYMININGFLRLPQNVDAENIPLFIKLVEVCQAKGYDLLMIKI